MKKPLNKQNGYTTISNKNMVKALLKDKYTKAVLLKTPDFYFDPKKIKDDPDFCDADKYWKNEDNKRRIQPGEIAYTLKEHLSERTIEDGVIELLPEHIEQETTNAGIIVSKSDVDELYKKMSLAMKTFSNIVKEYAGNQQFYMQCWQMWAPIGGQGRTPILHVDNTAITALWYVARTPADVYTGNIPDSVWPALDPKNKYKKKFFERIKEFNRNIREEDLTPLPLSTLIITRNAKEVNSDGAIVPRNLDKKAVRQTACPHRSGDLRENGQAGIVMVPKFF